MKKIGGWQAANSKKDVFPVYKKTKVEDLIPYALNSRTHSDEQVAQIAASIKEFGFTNPILIDETNGVIAGHGRLLAARKLGLDEVPTIVLSGLSDAQKRAYVIADNKIALNASWDFELLKVELADLELSGFDISLTGFDDVELMELLGDGEEEDDKEEENIYTDKIETPIYEPDGSNPGLQELIDTKKRQELIEEIEALDMPMDVRAFLSASAYRHDQFNFSKIANYYAQCQNPDIKRLMENSALVIIDYERAIELGFVSMTKELAEMYAKENQ